MQFLIGDRKPILSHRILVFVKLKAISFNMLLQPLTLCIGKAHFLPLHHAGVPTIIMHKLQQKMVENENKGNVSRKDIFRT